MAKKELKKVKGKLWGLIALQGVLAISFGIVALLWPGATLATLVTMIGVFVIIGGIVGFVISIYSVNRCSLWWLKLVVSVLVVAFGVFLLSDLVVSTQFFILLLGLVLIARGLSDVILAFFSKDSVVKNSQSFYIISGVVSLITGIIIVAQPTISSLVLIWLVGIYAIARGIITLILSFRVRSLTK